MARLQGALQNIVEVFVEYSGPDGKLSQGDMKKMMEKEFQCPEVMAKMKEVACAKGGDGNIDFDEFLQKMTCIAKCCYKKKTNNESCGAK